jgi:hypothetical protein
LNVRVLPESLAGGGLGGWERLPGGAAVAVQFLKQELCAGDGGFGDGKIGTGYDTLEALCLGQEREVLGRLRGEFEELDGCVLERIRKLLLL